MECQAVAATLVNAAAGKMLLDTTVTSARILTGTLTAGQAVIHATVTLLGLSVLLVISTQEDAPVNQVLLVRGVISACPTTLGFPWKGVRLVHVTHTGQQITSVMS